MPVTLSCHPSFRLLRQHPINSLNLQVEEFEHIATGARHIHLSADNPENVFLVALRTVPKDSTGVAHILEHTALCGSKKYPVRDPFFMMTRRSLNTFMNAFTSSDWTAYPFASMNRKDFNNLLDVYLDAVFFSRLDPLDFAQEGHRLEFAKADDPDSPLVYKGVVYNEMKGAMSSVPSQLWQTMTKHLYPTSTYHYNSGGDPEAIPDLSYDQLLAFYHSHYHPSNAIFMTYGDIPAAELQEKFETQALSQFERLDHEISVPDEKRYYAPVRVQDSYPFNEENTERKTHVVVGWLLGKTTNLEESLRAKLLSSVLLDNSATPLMHALETTALGSSPSPLCGLDDSQKEMVFVCGLEGCDEKSPEEIEQLIFSVINKVAGEGIPQEDVEAALHQLELHQREVGGGSYPYGLQLILTALTAATHRGDPVKLLDVDNTLAQLRKDIQNPDFIKDLARQCLIENPHYVRLTLTPDNKINSRKEAAEKLKLALIKETLSADEKQNIIALSTALKNRQDGHEDESILPKVTLADVPEREIVLNASRDTIDKCPITSYATGTNGLVYQQAIFEFPSLDRDLLPTLPLYSACITEVGVGDKDYMATQKWQTKVSGGLNAHSSIRGQADDVHTVNGFFTFSGKALNRNQRELTELMKETIYRVRFDEKSRLKDLISQLRSSREQSVVGGGHSLAMLAATAGICATAKLSHNLGGLAGTKALKKLDESLKDANELDALSERLATLHQQIIKMPMQLLLVGEEASLGDFKQNCKQLIAPEIANNGGKFTLEKISEKINEAWLTNSDVSYCAKAYPTVPMDHEDSAALVVLSGFLRNGFLHKAIREQGGAYGGGATQDNNSAAFCFYSYRDPRLLETLDDFDRSVQWVLDTDHSWQRVEEAILGVISSIDRSESPAGRAKRLFHADLHGRTLDRRQRFRERVLAVTQEELKRVAEKYLIPANANTAIVTGFGKKQLVTDHGLRVNEL